MFRIGRRDATKLIVGGSAALLTDPWRLRAAGLIDSKVRGVQIGAQSYSFRDRPRTPAFRLSRPSGLANAS